MEAEPVETDAGVFERHRTHLLRVGYRITGSLADAEDLVQESWLRFAALPADARAELRDERAWLTTVVGRLALDRLRSAAARRERYVGPWLPEPLVTDPLHTGTDGPLDVVVRDEGVRMAAMVVLEGLSPQQRVALVLHEALALPFAEIAGVLGCREATARQHATRARRIVAAAAPPPRARTVDQHAVVTAFADALGRADVGDLVALLHPDVVLLNDSDGRVPAARRPVVGADNVARLLIGLTARYGPELLASMRTVCVNGDLGVHNTALGAAPAAVHVFALEAGRISGIYGVLNPEKLTRLPVA